MEKEKALEDVRTVMRVCRACGLHETRKNVVPGVGNPDADIVLVGEGPGANEDEQGAPFIGRAGDKLTEFLFSVGLSRGDVFITNTVRCRPPNNRAPDSFESAACRGFLESEISIVEPKVIGALGLAASMSLTGKDLRIGKSHGEVLQPDNRFGFNVPVMVLYHPAALFYARDRQGMRTKIFSDLKKLIRMVDRGL